MLELDFETNPWLYWRMAYRCTFDGCRNTTESPVSDRWRWLQDWGPGIPDGYYCPDHAHAIEAIVDDIAKEQAKAKRAKH